jgi:pilus assembly protein CpaC
LIIWDIRGGRQFYNVVVRPSAAVENDNLDALRRELRTELSGQTLKINTSGGNIFLRGSVKDLISAQRAVKIATASLTSEKGKVVNLLNVDVPPSDPQILLKVRFASVDRNKAKSMGISLASLGLGNTIGGISANGAPSVIAGSGTGAATATFSSSSATTITAGPIGALPVAASIQALESTGVVEVLAEPNVLATNGKEASFLAGGEYPFPMANASGGGVTISIMFKEYGVRLNFLPIITPRGSIRLQVAPEVSALDFSNAISIAGFEVPAITSRKMQTEVELNDGQSYVIGGLLDNRETETFEKIPFLGDIPVLGKFFQSMVKNRTNTELIVIVTPEIVAPIEAGAPLPSLKFPQKFLPPNSGIPMNTPDAKTAANTPAPAPPSLPVEKLIDSMKPEPPLVIEGGGSGFGASSSAGASAAQPAPSAQ